MSSPENGTPNTKEQPEGCSFVFSILINLIQENHGETKNLKPNILKNPITT